MRGLRFGRKQKGRRDESCYGFAATTGKLVASGSLGGGTARQGVCMPLSGHLLRHARAASRGRAICAEYCNWLVGGLLRGRGIYREPLFSIPFLYFFQSPLKI